MLILIPVLIILMLIDAYIDPCLNQNDAYIDPCLNYIDDCLESCLS